MKKEKPEVLFKAEKCKYCNSFVCYNKFGNEISQCKCESVIVLNSKIQR